MTDTGPILEVNDLAVEYLGRDGTSRALDGVRLVVPPAEIVGIVGESGSGKSTLGMTVGRLLPYAARRVEGDLLVQGRSVFSMSDQQLRLLRRATLGFVFQNPISALDPTMTVERQIAGTLDESTRAAVDGLLQRVGLGDTRRVGAAFPHQLSGGMAQRVAIALAIARSPKLIVADEPTASLDASSRGQILELLASLPGLIGTSVLLLSHDLTALSGIAARIVVMYAGRAVEIGNSGRVFGSPAHPYTAALIAAAPGSEAPGERLQPIRGMHPIAHQRTTNCAFAPRCDWVIERCRVERPELRTVDDRQVLCHRSEELLGSGGLVTRPAADTTSELESVDSIEARA